MIVNNHIKLLIKLQTDKANNTWKWIHLCYIPKDIYDEYKENRPEDFSSMNSTLARWAKEDFNRNLEVISSKDLKELKGLIKDYYKETYPEVYLDQVTDRQGWLRVWISKKMKEDLNSDGE